MNTKKLSRRDMLKYSAGMVTAAILVGCAPAAPKTEQPAAQATQPEAKPTEAQQAAAATATEAPKSAPSGVGTGELLNLVVITSQYGEKAGKNANDIVTPYIEKMFNVKFDVRVGPPDQGTKEAYAMFKAAGTVPEIMTGDRRSSQLLARTGDFTDMTDNLSQIPNYMRWWVQRMQVRWMVDGRIYGLPQTGPDGNAPDMQGNIYYQGFSVWPLIAREDILKKCGYKFTPLADIAKDTTDKGVWPTLDALNIEPAIDTPEKWGEFLKQVKALNIMVGDKPLTPLSSIGWSVFHLSSMMDNGHWRIDDTGNVDGYLGTPGSHPYYKMWADWYKNDLIDKDYITQKDDQLQEKWSTGRVAAGLYVPNLVAARQALQAIDPAMMVRPIQWPKQDQRYGYFDVFEGGFWTLVFNKTIKDLPRIIKMIDYMNSDEGLDLLTWGPKEAGLYTTDSSGKKVWKDEETRKNIMENINDTKNAEYYGVFNAPGGTFTARAFYALPIVTVPVNLDPRFNYPPDLKIYDVVPKVYSTKLNCGFNTDGRASYGDGGEASGAVGEYYWSKFQAGDISKILTSKSDTEFEDGWGQIMDALNSDGQYPQAKKDMTQWFKEFGPKS
jgi:hypothetical protein